MTQLPPGWAVTTLDKVAEVRLGRQRSPKNHSGKWMRPYLRAANVTWSGLDLSDVKQMNFTPGESETYELRPGDVLIAEASGSADEVGKPAIWRGEIPKCCFQNTLLRVRSLGPLPDYLLWHCRHDAMTGRFGQAARGVGIHHLGAQRLSQWDVRVPPLVEQRRIVDAIEEQFSRLDAADVALGEARTKLATLQRSTFGLAVPAVAPERAVAELLEDIEAGKSFKTEGRPAKPDEWAVIKVSAMTWGAFREAENKAIPPTHHFDPRHEIRAGDLLLSRANTSDYVGATVLVDSCRPRLLLSDKSMRLVTKPDVDKRWLWYSLQSPFLRRQMSVLATGTSDSMRNISQDKVRALRIRVPSTDAQRRIVAEVERQLSIIDAMTAQIDSALKRSATLRRSILERAFRGTLVAQNPTDEPASELLDRITATRDVNPTRARQPAKRRARAVST